jgi:hypothetical protein
VEENQNIVTFYVESFSLKRNDNYEPGTLKKIMLQDTGSV